MSKYTAEIDGVPHHYDGVNGFIDALRHCNMAHSGKDGLSPHNVRMLRADGTVLFSTLKGERTGSPN